MKTREDVILDVLKGTMAHDTMLNLAAQLNEALDERDRVAELPRFYFNNGVSLSFDDQEPMYEYDRSGSHATERCNDDLVRGMLSHLLQCHDAMFALLACVKDQDTDAINNAVCKSTRKLLKDARGGSQDTPRISDSDPVDGIEPLSFARGIELITAWAETEELRARHLPEDDKAKVHKLRAMNYHRVLEHLNCGPKIFMNKGAAQAMNTAYQMVLNSGTLHDAEGKIQKELERVST
ncbi:hypothetical protein VPH49_21855 [Pseudomonas luteola]|uniref:hypothetical protein n=1 Tax=Pseudomonas luteola TaxID=47886 RepID=UPI003A8B7F65